MFEKLAKLLKAGEGKNLKKYEVMIGTVNSLEEGISGLSDEELSGKTAEFK